MRTIVNQFLSQPDLSAADIADAQIQLAKYLGYMGDLNESESIIKNLHASVDDTYPEKLRAKLWFQFILEEKRSLVFHTCMSEAEKFISAYSSKDSLYWKYLYRAHVIIAKLYQMLNSLELSSAQMDKAMALVDKNEQDKEGKHHGIMLRSYGYQYWKFFKKSKADEYLNKAMVIFEKIRQPYLISTIYKEKGDMHKELQEAE